MQICSNGFEIIAAEEFEACLERSWRPRPRPRPPEDARNDDQATDKQRERDVQRSSAQLPTRSTAQHLNLRSSIGHICSYTTPSRDDRGFTCIFGGFVSTRRPASRPQSYSTAVHGEFPRYSRGRTVPGRAVPSSGSWRHTAQRHGGIVARCPPY